MANHLTLDLIAHADDTEIRAVEVPEWGGTVFLRTMSGTERDAFEAEIMKRRGRKFDVDMRNYRANFLSRVLCTENGELLCTTREDRDALGRKAVRVLERLTNIAREMNGIGTDEDDLGN